MKLVALLFAITVASLAHGQNCTPGYVGSGYYRDSNCAHRLERVERPFITQISPPIVLPPLLYLPYVIPTGPIPIVGRPQEPWFLNHPGILTTLDKKPAFTVTYGEWSQPK